MVDVPSAILGALNQGGDGARLLQAGFVSADTTGAWVDVQGARVPAAMGTDFLPEVGEIVNVWNIGDRYLIMGPAAVKPDVGTVQSVTGGFVTLLTSIGTTVTCPYDGSAVTPSAGQQMKLMWRNGAFAMLMSTSPPPVTPPPAPVAGASAHTDVFTTIDAGSYGSGRWWTGEVWASDSNLGAWWYGSKINDTIPSGAVIQKVEIFVPGGTQISGSNPNFALHGDQSKPGGAPGLTTVASPSIAPGWVSLPNSVGDALKAGGGSWGVGVNHGGYNIFPSRAQDGDTGKLRIQSVY